LIPPLDGCELLDAISEACAHDELLPIPACADCGQVNAHGRYVAHYERIILEERAEEDAVD